jgi:hypothetical protein
MAAVTQTNQKYNVSGSMRDQYYVIAGATGDTLDVGLTNVRQVNIELSTITAYTVTPNTPSTGQSRITFTAGGPFTGVQVQVLGN